MTEYKYFPLLKLFKIAKIKHKLTKAELTTNGEYPCYSSDTNNYGILGYTSNPDFIVNDKYPMYLVFGDHTRTMRIATKSFSVLDNVKVLIPPLNSIEVLLYIIAVWHKSIPNLGYARHWTKAKDAKLRLPVDSHGNIDFQYMEDRVKALQQDRVRTLEHYLTVTGLDAYELTDSDKKVLSYKPEFSEFKIEDIFEIHKGKRLTKANQIKGDTLFIGSTALNHGETARIGQKPIFKANTITVCYNGSVGETFYQDEPYWASDDINVLTLRDFKLNAEVAEYLCTVLKKAGSKYGYTYKWNVSRMKKSIISLPVTANKVVDFQYMENYIKAVQKLTIKNVVKYKDEVIAKKKK